MLMWYQVVYYDDWQVGSLRSSCLFVWFVISGSRTDGEDPNIQLCIRVFRVVFQGRVFSARDVACVVQLTNCAFSLPCGGYGCVAPIGYFPCVTVKS